MHGAVYVQTNEPENRVIAFRRAADGGLSEIVAYATGGRGDAEPRLPSQGSVTLTGDGRHLLVANVASEDVSLFTVSDGGGLDLVRPAPAGTAPRSVAEHGGLVYVLATGAPAVIGLRLTEHGLEPVDGATYELSGGADPAQVGFSPDGSLLLVTERGTNSLSAFPVGDEGTLGPRRTFASAGPTPYGFTMTTGGTLVVTEAFGARKGAAAASSYSVTGTEIVPVTESVGNGRSEICWAVLSGDGRFVYATNFADGAVSRYAIGSDASLSLDDATAAFSEDGRPGLRDEGITADGRYLYAIDVDSGSILGWAVGPDGGLSAVASWDGLPPTVAGLACR